MQIVFDEFLLQWNYTAKPELTGYLIQCFNINPNPLLHWLIHGVLGS
jgi:hypothetical protein